VVNRIDIQNGDDLLVLEKNFRGERMGDDFAENAVHGRRGVKKNLTKRGPRVKVIAFLRPFFYLETLSLLVPHPHSGVLMRRLVPLILLGIALFYLTSTGFQCGSAETTSAKLYMQQKQWQKAEESLVKQLAKNDKDEEAWFLLGQVRLETRNYAGMNDAYARSLALGEVHKAEIERNRLALWAMLYNEGVNYYNRGRDSSAYYDKALEDFSMATMMVPDSANTYYVTALAHHAKKDPAKACAALETALQKNPRFEEAARLLGQIRTSMGMEKLEAHDTTGAHADYARAIAAFESAYKAQPLNAENIGALIDAYERSGQSDKAESMTVEAVNKDPNNKLYRNVYGTFLLRGEKYAEAIEQFKKALALDPGNFDAENGLGVAYFNWGASLKAELDKKRETQKKGGMTAKDDASYKEKFNMALPPFEECVRLRPDEAALWTQLGKVYAILNMTDKSRAAFERSDKLMKGK
jgi:tetratricopeptide (TPR) repeat protein